MKRTKSQLNAIYYSYRDRAERRRAAGEALYGWLNSSELTESAITCLKNSIYGRMAGEFVRTCYGYRESRHSINWGAVLGGIRWLSLYTIFERYRAAARAQKSPYYRRRLAKLGIDWRRVKRPYGTEEIEID